jgi:hypothetical protein
MFHHGIEWPMEERLAFQARTRSWPDYWFEKSESEHMPWIYYLSERFHDEFTRLIEATLNGLGKFVEEKGIGNTLSLP